MFPALFYPSYSTCELSFRKPILFRRISLSFIIEPNLDGCPVKVNVVQLGKFFYNTLRWISALFIQGLKGHFLQMGKFRSSILWLPEGYLTFCEGVISSTGTPVIKKNTSNTNKRITNEKKWYKKARNVSFVQSMGHR